MAALPMYVVEAFTIGANQPFTGNTAAVCVLDFDDDVSDEIKQKIGMQMNYSETAFVARGWSKSAPLNSARTNSWTIRWWTPTMEIDLCGYATLAASNVLFHQIIKKQGLVDVTKVKETTIVFETKCKGRLEATINWATGLIALNFPSNAPKPLTNLNNNNSSDWVEKLVAEVVGPSKVSMVDDVQLATGNRFLLLRIKDTGHTAKNAELITQLKPNFGNLGRIKPESADFHAVVVTAQGSLDLGKDKPQFYSRIFGPWVGIDEDPVCGSAHTTLLPYWLQQFKQQGVDFKSKEIIGLQLSARKGEFICSMIGENRVKMVGQSREFFSGEFFPA